MPVDPKTLPQDPATLTKIVVDLTAQLDRTERLLRQLIQAKTGRRSEQLSREQLALFAQEAGLDSDQPSTTEDESDTDRKPPSDGASGGNNDNAQTRGRKPLPKHLKRERIEHDLAAEEKLCQDCMQDMRRIGEESSERYEYAPAQMKVIEDVCLTYACACRVRTAGKPAQPIEKSTADAYVAYDSFFTDPKRGMIEVACMAHARRHVHQAMDSDPSRMRTVLLLISQLYRVEKMARRQQVRGEDLRLLRNQLSRPVLDKLEAYMREISEQLLPKSDAGRAVNYMLKNWTALTRFCDNPGLSIDNNHTERSLRGWAVGRSNWTFFGSDRGGQTAAVVRSFIASCELVKVDPFAWFKDVLARIPGHPVSNLDQLLPHRWIPAIS